MNKTLAETLTEARNSLTPLNWRKGSYFKQENDTLCMCAHGAVQALVNPVCRERLLQSDIGGAEASARADAGASAGASASAGVNWTNRHDWVKKDHIRNNKNYGNLEVHYLLGMVGLTTAFNDSPNTIYEMVIEKFNEAIQLANQFGV